MCVECAPKTTRGTTSQRIRGARGATIKSPWHPDQTRYRCSAAAAAGCDGAECCSGSNDAGPVADPIPAQIGCPRYPQSNGAVAALLGRAETIRWKERHRGAARHWCCAGTGGSANGQAAVADDDDDGVST